MKKVNADQIMGFVFGLVMLAVCAVLFANAVPLKLAPSSPDPPVEFEKGWITEDGAYVDVDYLYEQAKAPGVPITISKQLPETLYVDSYLNYNTRNIDLLVKVNDEICYGFTGTDPLGKPGTESYFQHTRLDQSYAGQTITIVATLAYTDPSCYIDDMVICSVNDYNFYYVQHHGLSFLLSMIIIFIGILMIIQYFTVPRKYHVYNTFALGIASVAVGLWSGIETQFPLLFFGVITSQVLMLKYICMYFAPFPLIVFLSSALTHRCRAAEWITCFASMGALIAMTVCVFADVITLHEGQQFFYALLAFMFIVGATIGVRSFYLARRDHTARRVDTLIIIAMFICAASLLLFFAAYVINTRLGASSIGILRAGFIIMQVILLASFMVRGNKNSRAAAESEAMRKLAYVDALTGIGNRTAFDLACDVLEEESGEAGFDFMLVCFDVDDLKKINDTYGHEYGDKHLIAASRVLKEAFGDIGEVFRVGGDEFTALIRGGDNVMEQYRSAVERLRALEDAYNKDNPDKRLRISCGTALFSKTEHHSIREVSKMADEAMYADKKAHKAA